MKRFFIVFTVCLMCFCCAGCNDSIGDGEVDAVESSVIRLSVGASMSASPGAIAPAYVISKALLEAIDNGSILDVSEVDLILQAEVAKLKLTDLEEQSMLDLIALLKAKVIDVLDNKKITSEQKIAVIRKIAEIVNQSAEARM